MGDSLSHEDAKTRPLQAGRKTVSTETNDDSHGVNIHMHNSVSHDRSTCFFNTNHGFQWDVLIRVVLMHMYEVTRACALLLRTIQLQDLILEASLWDKHGWNSHICQCHQYVIWVYRGLQAVVCYRHAAYGYFALMLRVQLHTDPQLGFLSSRTALSCYRAPFSLTTKWVVFML